MKDSLKTKQELIKELSDLKKKIKKLDKLELRFKESGEAVLESEENYRRLFETMSQGVVYQSADGKIISANPAAERILGLSLDQMQGKTSLDPGWKSIREDGSELPGQEHPAMVAMRTGKPVERFIMGVYNPKNNAHTWIYVSATPLFNPGEKIPFQVYATFDDITERKQAEDELLVSEKKFTVLFSSMVEGFALHKIIYDASGAPVDYRVLDVNPTYESIIALKRESIVGKRASEIYGTHEAPYLKLYSAVASSGKPESFETYFPLLNKHFNISVFSPTEGQFATVFQDITYRKQVEENLLDANKRLSFAQSSARAGVWDWDMLTGKLNWSLELFHLFGLDQTQAESSFDTWLKVMHPDDRQIAETVINESISSHKPLLNEYRIILPTGDVRWIVALGNTVYNEQGKAIRMSGICLDDTDRKRTENLLRESEDKYKKAFHTNQDAININRLADGMYILSNEGFTKITGYTEADVAGRTSLEINIWENKADRDRLVEGLKRDGKVDNLEANFRKKDGAIVRGLMSASVININGIPHIFNVTKDITASRQAEEEKKALEERLSRAEKMESLGLLAGGVAHDLNNVLGIVVGYAELLLDSVDEKSPLRKDLKTIFDGGQKAAAIVEDLLTLARRGVVGKKVLNLNRLITNFKESPQWSKLLTYHPQIQIKTELDPDLLNISASSVHLEKTLYNLVSNAGEAMTKGGTITIKTSNQYVDKPISGYDNIYEGDYVVLSVSDEGDGISETDLKRIFEPFYTKKIMGRSGTGLGLSVVWGTVKDHHGYIDVQSEEGRGTTFTLYFLITREEIEQEGLAVSTSEYQGNGQSLLVVDDVKDQRDLATRLLTSLNYQVSSVESGEEAIKYLKDHQPDLIVLDMIMDPGMDGLDTYKSVLEINPKQKAIIVSGFSESDRVKEAKTIGAGAYIKKPYIKEKLGLAVKKELERAA